ncbi:formyltetrahydrofolate deformylase [Lentzea fradiae]|uniref:Formyltetrahydrofolate deformylase n=1 Tax=Lentzea fradiae TaxID=200378 RepID=A0A1G7MJG7_9PSEU|nr:formyltetrahydrofolate deformylase [Lentzea fradiae]
MNTRAVSSPERRYVITFGCPDRTGIIARISSFLAEHGGWIVEAAYHTDPETGWFFTRQEVRADSLPFGVDELRALFAEVATALNVQSTWTVTDTGERKRVVILVSKEGHCLYDLLARVATGELDVEVSAVVGNHPELGDITRAHGIPFHHVPFPPNDPEGKQAAFAQLRALVEKHDPHAVVLARFMQILPPELCAAWAGRAINIHHSFLPSFIGARPYHQAHRRGVKLVGATCHYVTADLDAGPIIEQDVLRVHHGDSVADMVRKGRDIEKVVLARGLRWHLEDRVLVHGNQTVIF